MCTGLRITQAAAVTVSTFAEEPFFHGAAPERRAARLPARDRRAMSVDPGIFRSGDRTVRGPERRDRDEGGCSRGDSGSARRKTSTPG